MLFIAPQVTVMRLKFWNFWFMGVFLYHMDRVTFRDCRFRADPYCCGGYTPIYTKAFYASDYLVSDIKIVNVDIQGLRSVVWFFLSVCSFLFLLLFYKKLPCLHYVFTARSQGKVVRCLKTLSKSCVYPLAIHVMLGLNDYF